MIQVPLNINIIVKKSRSDGVRFAETYTHKER